jgi:DNA-binding ferritin-like protein (Dps family)
MSEIEKIIKETSEISKKLNEKNKELFTDIVCYFRVSSVEEKEREDIISDVLDMFLRYQEEGKPIEDAIGNNYKMFCDSIIESMSHKKFSLNMLWQNIKMIMSGVITLLTIDLIFNYIPKAIKQ